MKNVKKKTESKKKIKNRGKIGSYNIKNRKDHYLLLRMDKDLYDDIKKASKELGLQKAPFIRMCIQDKLRTFHNF